MSKQKIQSDVPTLPLKEINTTIRKNNSQKDSLVPPSSEEDRIVHTTTPKPAFLNYISLNKDQNLDLDYIKDIDKNELKFYFAYNTEYNQHIFCKAVEQNEKKIVVTILEINPELINIKALPEEYNILHIALLSVADEKMIKILLESKPWLLRETDKENLTPIKFVEKYGFNKDLTDNQIDQIKKLIQEIKENFIMISENKQLTINYLNDDLGELYQLSGNNKFHTDKFYEV